MSSSSCYCDYCPLIEAKVNICNLRVYFKPSNDRYVSFENLNVKAYEPLKWHFANIVREVRDKVKLKVGQSLNRTREDCHLTIDRLSRYEWKVCFHTDE